ncbi:MAG TPA: acyltransferase [Blastocatellia bacterium]|nr:acyltransferase [Blastocatellia bacterium]
MRSSSGKHFIALDHVRALAASIVFAWHFTHASNGYPVPFNYTPALFPFSILDEGHMGVALFMTLSGYLFAKLLDGKSINYKAFIWNRVLRIFPLLMVVIVIAGIINIRNGQSLSSYVDALAKGFYLPTLPNGGWSIMVECHYYVILPLLLWMQIKSKLWPLPIIVGSIALRWYLYHGSGEIQSLAYWTIVGRIDQFVLGMLAYQLRHRFARRHLIAVGTIVAFMLIYWYFDFLGGFYLNRSYPWLWIILPTIEGIASAISIAWYDNSFTHSTSGVSKFIGRLGEYSYSIYLLHFFVVFDLARYVNEQIMKISNFYVACLWSFFCFVLMVIPGYLSFRLIEAPFLKLRRSYVKGAHRESDQAGHLAKFGESQRDLDQVSR